MKRRQLQAPVVVLLLLTLAPAAGLTQAAAAPSTDIDPDAIAALRKMGAYLQGLKAFRVTCETARGDVLETGQTVEYDGTVDLLVQRPDKMRTEISSDRKARMWFYDGKSFTLYSPRLGYYATVPAPANLGALADTLEEKYGLELPLADLFDWGTDKADIGAITSATIIGPSKVDGTTCEHYIFRQEGVDWQLWIQQGANALPRKLVITTMTDDARPQYSAVMKWDLAPAYNEEAFAFTPPKGAEKIVFSTTRGTE
jgi:hypothetical protein